MKRVRPFAGKEYTRKKRTVEGQRSKATARGEQDPEADSCGICGWDVSSCAGARFLTLSISVPRSLEAKCLRVSAGPVLSLGLSPLLDKIGLESDPNILRASCAGGHQ